MKVIYISFSGNIFKIDCLHYPLQFIRLDFCVQTPQTYLHGFLWLYRRHQQLHWSMRNEDPSSNSSNNRAFMSGSKQFYISVTFHRILLSVLSPISLCWQKQLWCTSVSLDLTSSKTLWNMIWELRASGLRCICRNFKPHFKPPLNKGWFWAAKITCFFAVQTS